MKKLKRIMAAFLAGTMILGNTLNAFAGSGYEQFHGEISLKYADVTFRSTAQSETDTEMKLAGYWVATGLAGEMTSTLRRPASAALSEPQGYGKWWLRDYGGDVGIKQIRYWKDWSTKINVDFRKLVQHYDSCITDHATNVTYSTLKNGKNYAHIIGSQYFANFAYLPIAGAYPEFMKAISDGHAKKFEFLLMSLLHANHEIPTDAVWDSGADTPYSILLFFFTRCIEEGRLMNGVSSTPEADYNTIVARAKQDAYMKYLNPNKEGERLLDNFCGDAEVKDYFIKQWKAAAFLSYFSYGVGGSSSGGSSDDTSGTTRSSGSSGDASDSSGSDASSGAGLLETGVTISLPLSAAAEYAGGGYERHFDYANPGTDGDGTALKPAPANVYDYFTNLTVKVPSSSKVQFVKNGTQLIFTAPTAEDLSDDALGSLEILLGEDGSAYREESKTMAPGGLVSMMASTVTDDFKEIAVGDGQLRFAGYTLPFSARPGTYTGGGGGSVDNNGEQTVTRYQHSETFIADYIVNLRKYDSETGKGLADSHFDILEAFPEAEAQLGATELESADNWSNDTGSQFKIWDGWDYGDGNPDGDKANDPCELDNDKTNSDGLLKYSSGTGTAHTDTKTYTYTKGFCGGHEAKPQPVTDPETGEVLNQSEIDAWEKEVETCKNLIAESTTGYFCATAEKNYENGEDAKGEESKKEMEDDRDARYAEFISLTYDYSAKEVQARSGYIIHDVHTDDIPIETKTVTSSQFKDFNGTYGGDAAQLPHQDTASGKPDDSGDDGGDTDPDDGDDDETEDDHSYKEYEYTGTVSSLTSSKIKIKGDDGKTYIHDTSDIYGVLSDEDIEHLAVGCRVSATIIVFQGASYIDWFEFSTDPDAYKDQAAENSISLASMDDVNIMAVSEDEGSSADKADVYVSSNAGNHVYVATASDIEPMEDADGAAYLEHMEAFIAAYSDLEDASEVDEGSEELPDIDLTDDVNNAIMTADVSIEKATASNATASNAERQSVVIEEKESWIRTIVDTVRELAENFMDTCMNGFRYAVSLLADDDEDDADDAGDTASHPVRDSVTWTADGPGNYIKPLANDIVDHTFTVFDHRTEGEIHINKKDLDLKAKEAGQYDSYAGENADGTLEGAVYGLFAKEDIIHPDGHTDVVYQKDDLVAIATTDRNGDASFMTFTEAPGSTYDYEQGKVVKRTDSPFDGPDNLHKSESDGDAVSEDNEAYIGHDSNNQDVSLKDSKSGDNTVYYKHSSNQEGIEGLSGGHEVYPILNNEKNNGNCWIGRPLIANPNGSNYYVKELSRSEGYELSVTGKTNDITNGAGSENIEKDEQIVNVGSLQRDSTNNAWTFKVIGKNLTGDVHISVSSAEGAEFVATSTTEEPCEIEVTEKTEVKTPVIGTKDTQVILNGSPVEASVGDAVTVNGVPYQVSNASAKEEKTMGANPSNTVMLGLPEATTYNSANVADFVTKYNQALLELGYRTPDANAPWIRVKISGTSDTDWIAVLTSAMRDYGLIAFNRVRITDAVQNADGSTTLIVRYDYATKTTPNSCVYNPDQDALYVKQDSGNGYFVYVKVPADSADIISVSRNDAGFVTAAILKKFTASSSVSYPNALPAQDAYAKTYEAPVSYWLYDGVMQQFNNDGTLATTSTWVTTTHKETSTQVVERTTPLHSEYQNGKYLVTLPKNLFGNGTAGQVSVRMQGKEGGNWYYIFNQPNPTYVPIDEDEDSYLTNATLVWEDETTIVADADTSQSPIAVTERPIRQQVKVSKDTETLPETLKVWYCANDGVMNSDDVDTCEGCGRKRTVEETKEIHYAHDTYTAFFNEDLSEKKQEMNWITRRFTTRSLLWHLVR